MGILTGLLAPRRTVDASLADADWTAETSALGYADAAGVGITVNRDQAIAVPAVARARNIIVGTVGHLPLELHRDGERADAEVAPAWVDRPDPSVPTVTHVAWTVDDLLFHGVAYWRVTAIYADTGRPRHFARVAPGRVDPELSSDGARILGWRLDGKLAPRNGLGSIIQLPGHDDGVLARGALTIRTALELERASYRYAETPAPSHALKNIGADLTPTKRDELLANWKAARRAGAVGYLNAHVDLVNVGFDPAALQLVEARQHAAAEVARLMGVQPFLLGADQGAGSSMTYSNTRDERRQLVDATLRPYLATIEQRLSMPDVLPRGLHVRFDLDDYLRADAPERAAYYETMLTAGVLTLAEARALEGLPQLDQAPADTNQEQPA